MFYTLWAFVKGVGLISVLFVVGLFMIIVAPVLVLGVVAVFIGFTLLAIIFMPNQKSDDD